MGLNSRIRLELEQLKADSKEGMIRPEQVVEFARDPETALHSEFEWDDSEAAQKFRLTQARQVIRVWVRVDKPTAKEVRVMVSVPSDRVNGNGYRPTEGLAENYREEVVSDALKKVAKIRQGYSFLPELAPFFDELEGLVAKHLMLLSQSKSNAG